MSDHITAAEAAAIIGVRQTKIYALHAAGEIGGHTSGRTKVFSRRGCRAYVKRNRVGVKK